MPKIDRFHEKTADADVLKVENLHLDKPDESEIHLMLKVIALNRAEFMFR
jgi:hypothetical protein